MSPYFCRPFASFNRNSTQPPQTTCPPCITNVQPPMQQMQPEIQYPSPQSQMQMCPPCMNYAPITTYTGDTEEMYDMEETLEEDMDAFSANKGFTTDGEPRITTNPTPVTGTFLFKELTAYPNYGNPSGNADILYPRDRGIWNFRIPTWLTPQNLQGRLLISAVLDDHADEPVSRYSAIITINNRVVHRGRLPLQHGTPLGGRFTNWSTLTFDVPFLTRNNRIVIENTSRSGQNTWIGLDWMELRLSQNF